MKNNTFIGKDSLYKYLNPYNTITPLVELSEILNPFYKDGVRVYLKMMSATSLANIKSLSAWNMLKEAENKNELKDIDTLIENSSGNTVYSLSILGRIFGISTTKAIVSHQITKGKLKLLQFFGVQSIINKEPICPDPGDSTSGIFKAKKLSQKQKNFLNPGQYDNQNNPRIHEQITGPQIWNQTNGNIQIFCSGLGTTGTMVGTGTFLKKKNKNIQTISVVRKKNNPVPGPRTGDLLNETTFNWKSVSNKVVEVGTVESYSQSLELCRYGLLVGPSTGFNLKGLYKSLAVMKEKGELESLRDSNGYVHAVVIACDTPFPYFDEYFYYLDKEKFPEIENEELLLFSDNQLLHSNDDLEITIDEFIDKSYNLERKKFEKTKIEDIVSRDNILIIDIRSKKMYEYFHIPHAVWMHSKEINLEFFQNKKVFVVCQRGVSSLDYAQKLKGQGIEALSLKGGMIEWLYYDLLKEKSLVYT